MSNKIKIIRITTVSSSLKILLKDQLRFINENGFDLIGISNKDKTLYEVSENEGVRVIGLSMTRSITPLRDLISFFNLLFILIKEKPKIVHSHTPKAGIIGMLASFLVKTPIRLHTVAGLPLLEKQGVKRNILNFVEKLTYKCSTKIYPNSYGLKEIILKNSFTSENKIKVIGNGSSNGIDINYFNPNFVTRKEKNLLKIKLNIVRKEFVYIFIGRIVGDKGLNELIEAFDNLLKINNEVKLLLVGNFEDELDPLYDKTKMMINANNQIIVTGFKSDVRPYLAISDALVFPSYREGFPNVVMQAGAMGLPSIVSNINGCNEIIINNVNGIIIPPKSVKSLLDAMIKIQSDKNYFTRLRKNTRHLIESRYDRKLIWSELLNEYNKLSKLNK